jgi:hypothetical protein
MFFLQKCSAGRDRRDGIATRAAEKARIHTGEVTAPQPPSVTTAATLAAAPEG